MDDVVDEWSTAVKKWATEEAENALAPTSVAFYFLLSCCCFHRVARRHDIAHKIKEVGEKLEDIVERKAKFGFKLHRAIEKEPDRQTTSFVDVSGVHEREDEKKRVISKLLCSSSQEGRKGKVMELVGKDYFEILATRAFFQDFQETDEDSMKFKMHDIVHDFAQFLMKDECFAVEADVLRRQKNESIYGKARHAIITVSNWARFPESIYNARKLRSLLIRSDNDTEISKPLHKLLSNLKYLRLFDLSSSPIENIPSDVGKLLHLRYLDFSHCQWLKELPETISELYNLQSLDISWCESVKQLPQKMRKLIRLMYLEMYGSGVAFLPRGIEKLTSLRTLTNFIVGGGGVQSGAANLGELGKLK
ncbi:hypothetical protein OIU76_022520 [Salix suchowensis]|nr:hypothetical protein OIU76_022520 [Salix suchowensis]